MVVAALLAGAPGRPRWSRAATWIGTIALVAGLAWWRRGLDHGMAAAAAMAFGAFVHRAIERRIWVAFKLASYWASFVGTSAILIPLALAARDHGERVIPTPLGLGLALAMAVAATPLAVTATRAFVVAGGTPEPLDAPRRLCTTGIYRRLRHPIQLAEILFVAAGATAVGTRSPLLFLAAFTIALVGPVRFVEERRLAARFGPSFEGYRRRVAGYLPFGRRDLSGVRS
jgi:protein-S-isoprenylcysteine O-methyltransferase Ste14